MMVRISVVSGPDKGQAFEAEQPDRYLVGRSPDAHLCVAHDEFFSRSHCLIEVNPPSVHVVDLSSKNGTFVNGAQTAVREAMLASGNTIRGGNTEILIEVIDDPPQPIPSTAASASLVEEDFGDILASGPRAVRCLRCGNKAQGEAAQQGDVAFFCEGCRGLILSQPEVLRHHRIVRKIKEGGMGAVFLAMHELFNQPRALKVILPKAAMNAKRRQQFIREASIQARIQHENVVQVHELVEIQPGVFCMAMEFVDGKDADELLAELPNRRLDVRSAVSVVSQMLRGLQHAHDLGFVHRDVKSSNVMITSDARGGLKVKLTDFGLARSYQTSGASGFTRPGDFAGTIPFMAPEQILQFRDVKPSADLYSAAATLYHLLSGGHPHDFPAGRDPLSIILDDPIVPISDRVSGVPAGLAAEIHRGLERDPARRHPSCEAFRLAIQRFAA